ncbi:MAG TPA: ABC transporter permease [Clostridiaceae bacterium]|nr:ABC transporter permease [Clostridiaceae bacterium]
MKVFKLFLQIINKHKGMAIMYIMIMILIISIVGNQVAAHNGDFTMNEAAVAVIDHEQSEFSAHFKKYLLQDNHQVEVPDDRDVIADKFYDESLDYLVIIPRDFSETFAKDPNSLDLQTNSMLNRQVAMTFENKINNYLNIWNQYRILYDNNIPADKIPGIISEVDQIMTPSVKVASQEKQQSESYKIFSYLVSQINYVIIVLGFSIIGYSFLVMEDPLIKKRELVSGYPEGKRTKELFLAAFSVMFVIWLLLMTVVLIFSGFENLTINVSRILIVSNFVHLIAITALVLFVCHLYPKKDSSSFLGNVVGLSISFTTGIFITRDFLNEILLKISSITPTYWDVSNAAHVQANMLNQIDYGYILQNMLVMLMMAAVFILLTFVLRRMKLKEGI